VEDTTLVKIFPLRNADPTETANLITTLFPDDTSTANTGAGLFRPFGFAGGFGGGRGGNNAASGSSDRMKKMSHVSAVPDPRTRSLVVTAGKDLMPEIEQMVATLDARDDGKLKVHVYPLANAEPIDVIQVLQNMFPSTVNTGSSQSQLNSQTSNPLLNRSQTLLQQQNNTQTSAFGNTTGSGSTTGRGF
jgi:type II secretory pathway component GspD/PulD (secretin)